MGALLAVAPTVETAIEFAGAKVCEMVQSGTLLGLDTTDSEAIWSYRSLERANIGRAQDAYIGLGFMLAVMKSFQTPDWLPTAVLVPGSMRSNKQILELAYGTDVCCTGDQFALMFDKRLLNVSRSSPGAERTWPRELTITSPVPSADDPAKITRALCALELQSDRPKLESVAARQGILARTLQRRLREQGTTFRQIALQAVMEKANSLVMQSDWPIYRIALQLGYAETSQFSRAYKSWTGVSPLEARRLHLGQSIGIAAE
jgi:AraC-like DNA-binding protein